jgi:Mg-chelatase subunit ChlD
MIIDKLLIDDTNMDKQNITNKQVISKKGGQIMKKNVFKRVICLVIALMMIMPNLQGSMAYAEGSVPTADDIVLEKTATAVDGKMNTYDIQLSVTGKKIVIPKKADVILVLDNSNSMHNEKSNGKTLAKITEEAAHAFINGVLTADNNGNIRVAVVQYGTEARARDFKGTGSWTGNWSSSLNLSGKTVYTSDNSDAKYAVTEALKKFWYSGDGGTNTEGGFLMAQKVAGQKRTDAESIVIFMTDGLPTYRYRSNGNATSDGYGNQTSKQELNEAIDAAINLSDNGSIIYTVGLLSSFGSGSNQAKLAANLLSETPMEYDDYDDDNIMGFVNYSNRWKPASKYTQKYYPIYSNEDAPKKMKEIYEGLASIVMELATGYVVDVIPEYFELTPESKAALEGAGAEVDVTEDGVTTITYKNVSANETTTDLQGYTVVAKPGYYGTAYTNKDSDGKSAIYHYTLNTSEPKPTGTKEFPQPVVAINPTAIDDPTAADDYYTAKMGQTLTVGTEDSILNNDETNVLNDGGYTISPLKVHPDYVNKDIATTACSLHNRVLYSMLRYSWYNH